MAGWEQACLELVLVVDDLCGTIVDGHSSFCEAMFFFKGGIHEEDGLARFWRALLECLLE